jgi:hypothetical protein
MNVTQRAAAARRQREYRARKKAAGIGETTEQREARLGALRAYEARERAKDPEGFRARQSASAARWRERYPERAKTATRKWREQNRDQYNQVRRSGRLKNRVHYLWKEARDRALRRGVEFTITESDIPPMGDFCPLLGHPFSFDGSDHQNSPSLDRIDPKRGYVPGNVWVVGWRANTIKSGGTAEEHEMIARAMRKALA